MTAFDIGKFQSEGWQEKFSLSSTSRLSERGERENPRTATKDNEEAMGLLSLLRKLKRTEGEVRPHTE